MNDHTRTIILLSSAVLCCCGFASATIRTRTQQLKAHEVRIQNEIQQIEQQTAELNARLPALKQKARRLLNIAQARTIPTHNASNWFERMESYLNLGSLANATLREEGLNLPYGLDMSWKLRQLNAHVYPGFAPHQATLELDGPMEEITDLLRSIERYNEGMVITRIELDQSPQTNHFSGSVTLAFPQFLYSEDQHRLQQFAHTP